jgi:pseudaminic acid cytidylyltransferase
MKIAVIPARGGSKRIPRKNVKSFHGEPMIAYAINAALESSLFEYVIVSTEDQEIAEIAKKYGAQVPFMRPSELADDHTPTVPVIAHAISTCQNFGWDVEHVCCIYASVPFIRVEDIRNAFLLLQTSDAEFSFPIAEFPSAVQRALRRFPDDRLAPIYPEYELTRTQDLERTYHDAGQFYWGSAKAWCSNVKIHSKSVGLMIPASRVVDIDTPEDWERAELLFKVFYNHGENNAV